ncbi:MAG: IS66 family insertion sequence element accessory protein TnpA [Desulfitobacteriaceae bacterium]
MNKQEQQTLVAECRTSGMTAKAWCEAKGIEYQRYVTWATKVNREEQQEPQQWAEFTMKNQEHDTSEIRLNCGKWTICVEAGFSPALLADILRVVDGVC